MFFDKLLHLLITSGAFNAFQDEVLGGPAFAPTHLRQPLSGPILYEAAVRFVEIPSGGIDRARRAFHGLEVVQAGAPPAQGVFAELEHGFNFGPPHTQVEGQLSRLKAVRSHAGQQRHGAFENGASAAAARTGADDGIKLPVGMRAVPLEGAPGLLERPFFEPHSLMPHSFSLQKLLAGQLGEVPPAAFVERGSIGTAVGPCPASEKVAQPCLVPEQGCAAKAPAISAGNGCLGVCPAGMPGNLAGTLRRGAPQVARRACPEVLAGLFAAFPVLQLPVLQLPGALAG